MIKLQAVNDVIIIVKDRSIPDSPIILPNVQPKNMYEIPEPFTGVIDSIGVENEWHVGDRVAFDSFLGALYMKVGDCEYVVITPEMIIGKI